MNTIILAVVLFVAIMIAGGGLIVFKYLNNKKKHGSKNGIPVMLLTLTGNGFKAVNTVGVEAALNTQRVINIPAINRAFAYPTPDKFINGTLMYLQVSDVEWRPVTFTAQETFPTQLKELIVKITNNKESELELSQSEKKMIADFLHADKLTPVIDKAFATIYANNVERILKSTAVEDNSIWARLQKFMPAIMIVITAVAVVILIYGFLPLYQSVASTMQAGLHVVCTLPSNTSIVSTATPVANTTLGLP